MPDQVAPNVHGAIDGVLYHYPLRKESEPRHGCVAQIWNSENVNLAVANIRSIIGVSTRCGSVTHKHYPKY